MAKFNLASRTAIQNPCNFGDLDNWLATELTTISSSTVRSVLETVSAHLGDFVKFPQRSLLLWEGCDRIAPEGKRQRIHAYPNSIRALSKLLDTRPNGPAIVAYWHAGGIRPPREGSSNSWSIHHLYSGKFSYNETTSTLHAPRNRLHFTQSAGLVAAHPIADVICDEFPCFAWFLRAEAFKRFGYDPDGVFGHDHDKYGFIGGKSTAIIHTDA